MKDFNVVEFIDLLAKYEINEHQFIICWIVHTKDTKTMYKYIAEVSNFRRADIENLLERGILLTPSSNYKSYELDCMTLSGAFADGLFIMDIIEPGEELWKMYPSRMFTEDGKVLPLKTVRNKEALLKYYVVDCLKYSLIKHQEVLALTETYIEFTRAGHMSNVGIEKYIRSHMWEQVAEIKKELGYE